MIRVKNKVYLLIMLFFVFTLSGMEDRRLLLLPSFKLPKSFLGVAQVAGCIGGSRGLGEIDWRKNYSQLTRYVPGVRSFSFLSDIFCSSNEMKEERKKEEEVRKKAINFSLEQSFLNDEYERLSDLFDSGGEIIQYKNFEAWYNKLFKHFGRENSVMDFESIYQDYNMLMDLAAESEVDESDLKAEVLGNLLEKVRTMNNNLSNRSRGNGFCFLILENILSGSDISKHRESCIDLLEKLTISDPSRNQRRLELLKRLGDGKESSIEEHKNEESKTIEEQPTYCLNEPSSNIDTQGFSRIERENVQLQYDKKATEERAQQKDVASHDKKNETSLSMSKKEDDDVEEAEPSCCLKGEPSSGIDTQGSSRIERENVQLQYDKKSTEERAQQKDVSSHDEKDETSLPMSKEEDQGIVSPMQEKETGQEGESSNLDLPLLTNQDNQDRSGYFAGLKKRCTSFLIALKRLCGVGQPLEVETVNPDSYFDDDDYSAKYLQILSFIKRLPLIRQLFFRS